MFIRDPKSRAIQSIRAMINEIALRGDNRRAGDLQDLIIQIEEGKCSPEIAEERAIVISAGVKTPST